MRGPYKLKSTALAVVFLLCNYTAIAGQDNRVGHFTPHVDNSVVDDKVYDIEADNLYHDKKEDIFYAYGNVELKHDNAILFADYIIYNQNLKELYAYGNIALREQTGNVLFADVMRLDEKLSTGTIGNLNVKFSQYSRISSSSAELIEKNRYIFNNMVYSPCKICADNFVPNTPLWQIRSKQSVLDKNEGSIKHESIKLDIFGKPVMYLPFAVTPAPKAKRKTGLLLPTPAYSSVQGASIYMPIYFNIAPNLDATIGVKKHYNKVEYDRLDGQMRYITKFGKYEVNVSANYDYKDAHSKDMDKKKHLNSHIQTKISYNDKMMKNLNGFATINSTAILGSDRTYLMRHKINEELILNSDFHTRYYHNSAYYSIRGLYFQDMRPLSHSKTTAMLLPGVSYINDDLIPEVSIFKTSAHINYSHLYREQGTSYQRVITEIAAEKKMKNDFGLLFSTKASLRADFYDISLNKISVESNYKLNQSNKIGSFTRNHPKLTLSLERPMYKVRNNDILTINPVIQFIVSPHQKNKLQVANEDSNIPLLSVYNLFLDNRYNGFDIIDDNIKVNYGATFSMTSSDISDINVVIGQSYKPIFNDAFDKIYGMDGKFSNYLTNISFKLNKNLKIEHSTRIDNTNFRLNMHEISSYYTSKNFRFTGHYWSANSKNHNFLYYNQIAPHEVKLIPGYNIINQWWIDFSIHAIVGNRPISRKHQVINHAFSVKNYNECLQTDFTIQRDYNKISKNTKPETTYMMKISIPTF